MAEKSLRNGVAIALVTGVLAISATLMGSWLGGRQAHNDLVLTARSQQARDIRDQKRAAYLTFLNEARDLQSLGANALASKGLNKYDHRAWPEIQKRTDVMLQDLSDLELSASPAIVQDARSVQGGGLVLAAAIKDGASFDRVQAAYSSILEARETFVTDARRDLGVEGN